MHDALASGMRSLVVVAALSGAGIALAQAPIPANRSVPAIDFEKVPDPCKPLARFLSAPSPDVALSGRITLATCMLEQRSRDLALVDSEKSVLDLEAAAKPSLDVLDDVIAADDAGWQVVALHAKGEMLQRLGDKMLATIAVPPPEANETTRELYSLRLTQLRPLIQPWFAQSQDAFRRVDRLAKANPSLANKKVVANAIADSQKRVAPETATR